MNHEHFLKKFKCFDTSLYILVCNNLIIFSNIVLKYSKYNVILEILSKGLEKGLEQCEFAGLEGDDGRSSDLQHGGGRGRKEEEERREDTNMPCSVNKGGDELAEPQGAGVVSG